MSEMIERVKAALIAQEDTTGGSRHLAFWDEMAGAAIKAMREPTPDMLSAGDVRVAEGGDKPFAIWAAMIDAAIED